MKLKELYKKEFKKVPFIGIYEGKGKSIYPEYADELLETHGDMEVVDYLYIENKNTLVVQF